MMWELNKLDRMLFTQIVVALAGARDEAGDALKHRIQMSKAQLESLGADIRRAKDELWGKKGVSDE